MPSKACSAWTGCVCPQRQLVTAGNSTCGAIPAISCACTQCQHKASQSVQTNTAVKTPPLCVQKHTSTRPHLEEAAAAGVGQAVGTIAGRAHGPGPAPGGGCAALAAVGVGHGGHHCVAACGKVQATLSQGAQCPAGMPLVPTRPLLPLAPRPTQPPPLLPPTCPARLTPTPHHCPTGCRRPGGRCQTRGCRRRPAGRRWCR